MSDAHFAGHEPPAPRGAVATLLDGFRDYLALDDPAHVLFALGVAVAAHFDGDPLWGLLVGAPSSGKTETLRALDDVADEHLDEISAPGLLSWLPGKKAHATGLLARRQGRIFATVADLSTLLATSDRGGRDQLYALLRRAYDGRVVREVGNAPGPLRWEGRLTLLAAVTPAVDNYSSHSDALGPRWLFLRLPATDDRQRREMSRKARERGLAAHRKHVRELTSATVTEAASRAPNIAVTDQLGDALDDFAIVACLGRATVPRDGYGRREIIGLPTIEEPPRLVGQLATLARGLLALGLPDDAAAALCRRAALDSMPLARRACLAVLATGEAVSQAETARRAGCDRAVARVALEDLAAAGITTYIGADRDDDQPRGPWHLTGDNANLIHRVFTDPLPVAKSVEPPPNPPRKTAVHEQPQGGTPHFATAPPTSDEHPRNGIPHEASTRPTGTSETSRAAGEGERLAAVARAHQENT